MLAEELSTIPLNLKTIFRQRSDIHDFFACLFVVTFFLSRLIYGTIICVYTCRAVPRFLQMASNLNDTTSIVLVIAQIILFILTRILNLYWTVLIVRKVTAAFRNRKAPVLTSSVEINKKDL
jgi:hypothetical protein